MHLPILAERELMSVLLSLSLLLLFAFSFGKLFQLLHAPKVVGQITGGIILGGTCLGLLFPDIIFGVFQSFAEEGKTLNIFYQLGLIFLMFASGLNTKIDMNHDNAKIVGILFIGATILPFVVGFFIYPLFMEDFIGELNSANAFMLIFLISLAVTSIPVISQIFFDLKLMGTNFANTVLTVATIQDLFLWIFLNVAISMATGHGKELSGMLVTIVVTIALFIIAHQASKLTKVHATMSSASFCTLIIAFLFLMVTSLSYFHINLMYSAFITGYIVKFLAKNKIDYLEEIKAVSDVSFSFFIPIYFALIGIQLNLVHDFSFERFLVYFMVAFGLEFIGCYLALQFTNLKTRAVLNFSIVMNARGGPGIVLATVAYYYKIINVEFFTILILTTMLSSAVAGYWLEFQKKVDVSIFTEQEKLEQKEVAA